MTPRTVDELIDLYAKRYVEKFDGFEDVDEYAEQAALDIGRLRLKKHIKEKITTYANNRTAKRSQAKPYRFI